MDSVFNTLIYYLHSDDKNFEGLLTLEEVYDRAVALALESLSDKFGVLTEESSEDFTEACIQFRSHINNSWENYGHFWEDIYD
ncbi:hypothetical protein VPHK406_0176 [Vibrio phage K406]